MFFVFNKAKLQRIISIVREDRTPNLLIFHPTVIQENKKSPDPCLRIGALVFSETG